MIKSSHSTLYDDILNKDISTRNIFNTLCKWISDQIGDGYVPQKYWDPYHPDASSELKASIESPIKKVDQLAVAFEIGIGDGLVSVVQGVPDICVLVTMKPDELYKILDNISFEAIWDEVKSAHTGNEFEIAHQVRMDVVFVVSMFVGAGEMKALATGGKAGVKIGSKSVRSVLKKGVKNVTKVLRHKPSWMPDRVITATKGKTTTLIGNYVKDMKGIIDELKYPETTNFGARNGDFNVLNVPSKDASKYKSIFFEKYNKSWLEKATKRGDDIVVLSDKSNKSLLFNKLGEKSGFANEIEFMNDLVKKGKYKFDTQSGIYRKIK